MFEPANDAHAITEVIISASLLKAPKPTLEKMIFAGQAFASDDLKERSLPMSEQLVSVRMQGDETGPKFQSQEVTGTVQSRVSAAGKIEWQLEVGDKSITVRCMKYLGWEAFFEQATSYFEGVVAGSFSDHTIFGNIVLAYVDRFSTREGGNDLDFGSLLRDESDFLSKHVFNSGPRFHCHTGWFEAIGADRGLGADQVLNQLEVSSLQLEGTHGPQTDVVIKHTASIPPSAGTDFRKIFRPENGILPTWRALMNHLHEVNKGVMVDLLTPKMQERISL